MTRRVRSTSAYRTIIARLSEFRVVHQLDEDALARLGLDQVPADGTEFLPAVVGKATEFNARGKEVVRRDLPMETRSKMIHTSWKDWHGQRHDGVQYRTYDVYTRDLITPPGEMLIIATRNGITRVCSRELSTDLPENEVVNLLNIFLEIFGDLEIVDVNLDAPAQLRVRRLAWRILPQGEYPFERARDALRAYIQKLPDQEREVATERIRVITQHRPDFLAVGVGGFDDYVVFGFTRRNRYVLESPFNGNATYIFRDDWQTVAQLSKAEILQGELQEARIVHNARWPGAIRDAVNRA